MNIITVRACGHSVDFNHIQSLPCSGSKPAGGGQFRFPVFYHAALLFTRYPAFFKAPKTCFDRTLDLGCGRALTSVFLANETPAKSVCAFDLRINATDNLKRIRALALEDRIIPIHGDALDMPFAQDWFDAVVSVDSYHYFGCKEGIFAGRILPFVRRGGTVLTAVPGLREEPRGETRTLLETWAEGGDSLCFRTVLWWQELLEKECGNQCDISVLEAECGDDAWEDWFSTGHEYGIRDREFLSRGLDRILNFPLICVRKKQNMVSYS